MSQRINRRALMRMALAGTATAATGYTLLIEPSELQIEQVKIRADLPTRLRIGALSDFHLADTVSRKRVEEAVRLITRQSPDIIVLLGDYSTAMHSGRVIHRHVATALDILSMLSAPLGVYAILGNHDITPALPDLGAMISSRGLLPLIDKGVLLTNHGERFALVGLNDALQAKPKPKAATSDIPHGTPTLGLVHEPDASSLLSGASLVLSGHSHGGQVRLPFLGAPVLPQMGRRFPWGLRDNDGTLVYTTRGVGMVPPRIRLNCRPEITLIEIVNSVGETPMQPVG